jgi:peroxin-2
VASLAERGWGGQPRGTVQRAIYDIVARLDQLVQFAHCVNFIAYLAYGRYRSLAERVLMVGVRSGSARGGQRVLALEWFNQQLAWNALAEFALFALPLVDVGPGVRAVRRVWEWSGAGEIAAAVAGALRIGSNAGNAGAADAAAGASSSSSSSASAAALPAAAVCPVCTQSPPVQPFVAQPCGHVYCYYCLSATRLAEQQGRGDRAMLGAALRCLVRGCGCDIVAQVPLPGRSSGAAGDARDATSRGS